MKKKQIGKICYLLSGCIVNEHKVFDLLNHQTKNISSVSIIVKDETLLEMQHLISKSANLYSTSMLMNSKSKSSFQRIINIICPNIIIIFADDYEMCNFVKFANIKYLSISFSEKELFTSGTICIADNIVTSSQHMVNFIEDIYDLDLVPKHYLQKKAISYKMKFADIFDSIVHFKKKIDVTFEKEWGYKLPPIPTTYNEKINLLKSEPIYRKYRKYVDKKKVRKYLCRNNYEDLLPSCYGIVKFCISNKLWQTLPERFVIKPTNASGFNFIIEDKSQYDLAFVNRILSYIKAVHYGLYKNEPVYSFWNDFIITEFIEEATDYKFFCFHGKIEFVCVVNELKIENERHEPYQLVVDRDFNELPFSFGYERGDKKFEKPTYFSEMIATVEKISDGFEHVRIDMIGNQSKYFFTEYTFFPGGGRDRFYPQEYDSLLLNAFSSDINVGLDFYCVEKGKIKK